VHQRAELNKDQFKKPLPGQFVLGSSKQRLHGFHEMKVDAHRFDIRRILCISRKVSTGETPVAPEILSKSAVLRIVSMRFKQRKKLQGKSPGRAIQGYGCVLA
jgi:hypothetical protein